MHRLTATLAGLMLAACSNSASIGQADEKDQVTGPERTSVDPLAATTIAAYAGTYSLEYQGGETAVVTFLPDGQVSGVFNEGKISARFTVPKAGQVCFDEVSTGDPPHCWSNAAADGDGMWVATMDDGSTLTVTPIDQQD